MDPNIAITSGSLSDRDSPVRFRSGTCKRFAVGDGLELVYCSDTGAAGLLHSESAALLGGCASFETLERHARELCGGENADREALSNTHVRLKDLADSGFLISEREPFEILRRRAAPPPVPTTISSMCFPTCNRVEAMKRCLESYMANCRQYGKKNDFVVMDDSCDPEVRKAYRQMLTGIRVAHDASIKYAGLEEKRAFLSRLVETGDLPPDVVQFALFGNPATGLPTYGANQNAILLHTIGDAIFCADDDTLCRIAAPPTQTSGLFAVSGAGSPELGREEVWTFPDRETALKSVDLVDACLLDMHERFLGMELGSCISAVAQSDPVDLDSTDASFHRLLRSGEGRIRVTVNGLLGDCGFKNPSDFLTLRGASLERLTRQESEYRVLRTSRECLRVVDRVTVSDFPPSHSTFLGLDNRQVLPPFLPEGRGQDVLFEYVLLLCSPDTLYARLPWALLHDPVEVRSFSSRQLVERGGVIEEVYRLITWLVASSRIGTWPRDPNARLRRLGSHLEEIGRLPAFDFRELVCLQVWQAVSVGVSQFEQLFREVDESRQFWVDDVKAFLSNRRDRLLAQEVCLPHDLCERRDPAKVLEIAQQLVYRFGQLLHLWPDILESARVLRAEGYALAKPV